MKKHRTYSYTQKEEYQLLKLKKILKTAENIPFYKRNIPTIELENLTYSDFCKLPFLTKDDIRSNTDDIINKEFVNENPIYRNTSGGSTGEPVELMQTFDQRIYGKGNYHYANYLNGITPFDNMLIFWGALRDMRKSEQLSTLQKIKIKLKNENVLNTFVLNDKIIFNYINQINAYRPTAIKAYVHSMYEVAKHINQEKIKINCKPIIHTSTGPLYPEIKSEIKEAFNGAHVFSFYGSREVGPIATETMEENGFEVLYDNVLVEIVDDHGQPVKQNEEGEIVVTTLNNFYMPLIRFKIGDRGIKADSDLQFGTLKLKTIVGRTIGVIYRSDGTFIDGQFFTTLFFNKKGIKSFQIVQESLREIKLNLVRLESFESKELDGILKRISEALGDISIEVNFVSNINLTSTGKIMYVYSKLQM